MPRTPDLVDILNNRCRKSYLHEALTLAYQEISGCGDVEPEFLQMRRLATEAELLIYGEESLLNLEY